MFREIREWVELLFLWGFLYLGAIFILILGIVHLKSNQPIIKQYHSHNSVQVIDPPKKIIAEEEICTRIDGCRIIDNVCIDCELVSSSY